MSRAPDGFLLLARTGKGQWAVHIETRKIIRIEVATDK